MDVIKISPKIIFLFFILFVPLISFAGISKIVFVTDPQSVKPNVLSNPITIQTQDSGGNSTQTPETMDLQFLSTSATGEFLNSVGNLATDYMSKNTANRTFYYRDSSEGTFVITVKAKGRETGAEFEANQQIIVSSNSTSGGPSSSGTVSSVVSSGPSQFSGNSTTNVSTQNSQLDVSAGNDRITSPGSPIWFQAVVKKNTVIGNLELNWSFGDGEVGAGSLVSHTYKYPGDYVVVLSARSGDIFSVSRLRVKVFEANMSVLDKGQYLEIKNNGDSEINLFNWKIENEGRGFVFQPNTILLPRSVIKLDKSLLKMKGSDNSKGILLKNGVGEEIFYLAPIEKIETEQIVARLKFVEQEALVLQEKAKKIAGETFKNNKNEPVLSGGDENNNEEDNVIYEMPKTTSFISRLTNFIKGVFFR